MRIQEISRILASGRTFGVILSPPVSSLSFARNHRPLRSAPRPWRLPALNFSDKCQVTRDNLCVAACLRVVRGCIRLRIPFFVSPTLSARICGNSVDCKNSINKCIRCFRHSPLCFWPILEKSTRLVFGGRSGRACFHSLCSYRFRCHGKHGFL